MSDESLSKAILGEDRYGLNSNTSNANYYPNVNELDPAVLRMLQSYFYNGKPLTGGARSELNRLWTGLGKPAGSLENWINAYVMVSLK